MLKRLAAFVCAVGMAVCGSFCAFAEPDDNAAPETPTESVEESSSQEETPSSANESSEAPEESKAEESSKEEVTTSAAETKATEKPVTEAPKTEATTSAAETQPTETQTTTETTKATEPPSSEPTIVALHPSEIEDDSFELELVISPERAICNAVIEIKYDEKLFELDDTKINSDIGGMPTTSPDPGILVFKYINGTGTTYSGTYLTLYMDIIDKDMTSSVIYVSVDTLEDTDTREIPNNISNAVINYREDSTAEIAASKPDENSRIHEGNTFRVRVGDLPLTLEELGVKDPLNVMSVKSLDNSIARYEQGAVSFVGVGQTEIIVRMNDDSEQRFTIIVSEALEKDDSSESDETDNTPRNIAIAVAVIIGALLILIEYIVICKPFRKKKPEAAPKKEQQPAEPESVVEYDEDDVMMVQDPEEVFKRKPKPQQKPQNKPQPKPQNRPQSKPQNRKKPAQGSKPRAQGQQKPTAGRPSGKNNNRK